MIDSKDNVTTESSAEETPSAAEPTQEQPTAGDNPRERSKAPVPAKYRHFKHMSPRSHQWIEKNCGAWVLEAMRNYLFDPDRVFPDWGTRFAVTLKDIGREDVERMGEAEVLYDYVMSSPFWEINYQIRKRLMATKPQRKRSSNKGQARASQQQAKTKDHAPAQAPAQAKAALSPEGGDVAPESPVTESS